MNRGKEDYTETLLRVRSELVTRLRARLPEIEEAVLERIRALSSAEENEDRDYDAGLRATVADVIAYALAIVELGDELPDQIPSAATTQARRAARNSIGLGTVLRRYAAGDRLLGEFIMSEADHFPNRALRKVLHTQGARVDRLMADVSDEYVDELERMRRSPAQRLTERVQRLLSGDESIEPPGNLDYELDAWHLGAILVGESAEGAARSLVTSLHAQALIVPRGDGIVWAWLGSRRPITPDVVEQRLPPELPPDVLLALGEPCWGVEGWRLSHREAQAAFDVMIRKPQRVTRSRDVILLAAVLRDETLTKSLRETYLVPLNNTGDTGRVLRETLSAYFGAGLNAATAAAALGVDRHTVHRRLRKAEDALGCLLTECHAQLEVALSLEELDESTAVIDLNGGKAS